MGKTVKRAKSKKNSGGSVTMNLFGPGMTGLHKVGLAGLWMTLKALEDDGTAMRRLQKTGGSWERQEASVTLQWDGKPEKFFKVLFEESFKLNKNGLLWFPALGESVSHRQHARVLQGAVLGSFFQHPDATWKLPEQTLNFGAEGEPLVQSYRPIGWYYLQGPRPKEKKKGAASAVDMLLDRSGSLMTQISIKGLHFPGAGKRHEKHDASELSEPVEHCLCLFYAPVGAIYFAIQRRGGGVRPQFALVLPEIRNLEKYARARASFLKFGAKQLYASGTAEAGLRVLSELHAAGMLEDIGSAFCRVISFGIVPWSKQQKSRVEIFTVQAGSESALRTFALCRQFFEPRLVKPQEGDPFWDIPQVPDLVARNLSEGRQWWDGFGDFVGDQERRDHVFGYMRDRKINKVVRMLRGEKGGLAEMVENKQALPDGPERMFVMACHEALRRHMGKKFARPGGADWGNEFEKVRVSIARCKNTATFRESITDFWARAGALHKGEDTLLKAGASWWQDVMPLLDEKNWRKAKDLALLALASYPGGKDDLGVKAANQTAAKGGK
jgi:CRISPR-associated protein Cas8a1/Csx13